jgi:NADP-dependent 3-hydroxy acid dehydrogenase YdfG
MDHLDPPLNGRSALITGASSGIGRAIAERLARDGAAVHLLGRTVSSMEETVSAIEAAGGTAAFTALDVRDTDALADVVAKVADDSGLDIMVNSAGLGHWGKILDGTVVQWREMLEVNVLGLLVGCWSAIAAMRRTGRGGHIVNISSIAATRPDSGVYGATKAAVNHLTAGLRQELEQDDIRITSLMPGVVATNFVRHMDPGMIQGMAALVGVEIDVEPGERLPEEVIDKAQEAMEVIIAKAEDIADVVAYIVGLPRRLNIPEIIVRPAQTSSLL